MSHRVRLARTAKRKLQELSPERKTVMETVGSSESNTKTRRQTSASGSTQAVMDTGSSSKSHTKSRRQISTSRSAQEVADSAQSKDPAIPHQALSHLQSALDSKATEKSRSFWTDYVKGSAPFRGVPMASVRSVVHKWWREENLAKLKPVDQKRAALYLFDQEHTEDRMAGVLLLSELLMPHLSSEDLPALADLFQRGRIHDWNLCDWFCVKVTGKMIECASEIKEEDISKREVQALVKGLSGWSGSNASDARSRQLPLWQRRASCVSYVYLTKIIPRFDGMADSVIANCTALVEDDQRFAQTGVAWTMRELSTIATERPRVVSFIEEHIEKMSVEAVKSITQKLSAAERNRLIKLHKTRGKA